MILYVYVCGRPEPVVPQEESETVEWDPEEAVVVSSQSLRLPVCRDRDDSVVSACRCYWT